MTKSQALACLLCALRNLTRDLALILQATPVLAFVTISTTIDPERIASVDVGAISTAIDPERIASVDVGAISTINPERFASVDVGAISTINPERFASVDVGAIASVDVGAISTTIDPERIASVDVGRSRALMWGRSRQRSIPSVSRALM